MPGTPTTKYAIPTLAGTTLARDIDTEVNAGLTAIDGKMVGYSEGVLASRPTSTGGTPGVAGRIYGVTDQPGRIDIDNGTGWDTFWASQRGKSIIATEETRTSASLAVLTTPDRVANIVTEADALLMVGYFAEWKTSAATAVAELWIDGLSRGNQASVSSTAYTQLSTTPGGLLSGAAAGGLTTGLVYPASGNDGGFALVYAPAGTHTIEVRFATTGGATVSVRNRKLWVIAQPF